MNPIREHRLNAVEVLVLLPPEDGEPKHRVAVWNHKNPEKPKLSFVDYPADKEEGIKVFERRLMFKGRDVYNTILK